MRVAVISRGADTVVGKCLVAESFRERLVGLLGRGSLPSGEGMLFGRTSSVHTWFMRFPIDVVFLDRNGVVVGIRPAVPPWRAVFALRARSVLELAAGESTRLGLRPGDALVVG